MRFLLTLAVVLASLSAHAEPGLLERGKASEVRSLALRFEHGEGVPRDYTQARGLYCLAAMRGDAEALFNLGWMYANGRGVERDDGLAGYWLEQASRRGVSEANPMLGWLNEEAAQRDPDCLYRIGRRATLAARLQTMIRILAPEFGLDPALVIALVKVESNFNPRALSPKGAQGLMQLMPATAKRFGVRDPWNPVHNLLGGMVYLTWLMEHFDGDVELVLAAYNAGEKQVGRSGGIPPFPETRRYVQRIVEAYRSNRQPYVPRQSWSHSVLLPGWVRTSLEGG